MADQYFGIDRGADGTAANISTGTSLPDKDIVLVVDDAVNANLKDVELGMKHILRFIKDENDTIPGV